MNARHNPKREVPPVNLPHSLESEATVISNILFKGSDAFDDITPTITAGSFFNRAHRLIFESAFALHEAGKHVDLVTVTDELQRRDQLESIGGAYAISKAAGYITVNLPYHVKVVAEKARLRQLVFKSDWIIQNAHKAEDAEEFISQAEREILDISQNVITEDMKEKAGAEVLEEIDRKMRGEQITGLKTGIDLFDDKFGGLKRGRFIVIGARPGRGKTAMVEQIAENLTANGEHVTFFEKDIHPSALMGRMACRIANVPYTMLDRGCPSVDQFAAVSGAVRDLLKRPLQVLSPPRLTGYDVRAIVRKSYRQNRTSAVILDHFQLLDHDEDDMTQGLTRASIQIKQGIQETGVPHIVVAQLNRDADKNGRPMAGNVKQCDQLFADCDLLLLLWGDDDPKDVAPGEFLKVKCTIAKNRYGPVGEEELLFDGSMMRFMPRYKGHEAAAPTRPRRRRHHAAPEPEGGLPYKE